MCGVTHWHAWHDSLKSQSYMWNDFGVYESGDSFTHVNWLIHMCDMTHWHAWHDSLKSQYHERTKSDLNQSRLPKIRTGFHGSSRTYQTRFLGSPQDSHFRFLGRKRSPRHFQKNTDFCSDLEIQIFSVWSPPWLNICDMRCVWYDLGFTSQGTHSHMLYEVFICVTWLLDMHDVTQWNLRWMWCDLGFTIQGTRSRILLNSFICVTWLIDIRDKTHHPKMWQSHSQCHELLVYRSVSILTVLSVRQTRLYWHY